MAVALLFVSVGVSFAHDVKVNSKKVPGNAYGHYKKGYDYHPSWYNKQPKPKYNFRDRYRHRELHKFRHYYEHHNRHAPRGRNIIGFKANDPDYKIVVVVKDRR
jgi:hypothetical protein